MEEENLSEHDRHWSGKNPLFSVPLFFKVKVGTSKFSRLPKLTEPAIFLTGVARQRNVTLWGANLLLCQLRIALSVFLFDSRSRGNFWYFHEAYRLLNERCEEPMKTALILNWHISFTIEFRCLTANFYLSMPGWSSRLWKILDKVASSVDKEESFWNDDETRGEKAAVRGKILPLKNKVLMCYIYTYFTRPSRFPPNLFHVSSASAAFPSFGA